MNSDGGTILLVDDDPSSRRLVRAALRPTGYRIHEAADGHSARRAVRDFLPALVLLDVRLGDGSGLDLLRRLRGEPRLAPVPVMAITAHALREEEGRIRAAGCDCYLAKPVDTRRLRALVEGYMRGERDHG